jgi:hypothetical protein
MEDTRNEQAPAPEAVRRRSDRAVSMGLVIAVAVCIVVILAIGLLTIALRS